ncbi:ParB/RepB/Spo0J family partition protein [Streptomyces somaliensis DSM 40738]|uniref:ParB/RepB/Spo0J family partition protein n=1 Tax=Streptomyces somaliensis (strain ATCC 33201 / DSM 40738 / JCM 12659 / KCTC 9044 / NCTC 11332 / NRRL B-12077 / IP 733) TaxID=1134445 RepID=A0AA44DBH7_STRE0|nr:ParB/RepB/Spo0J family partition protein [Streptomyces somaliensis]MCQ0024737.1 ParB/RepB/Spo0J family partition protein [Streptomyces somaliensis DSM 40738]NKY13211.1 ParB/RepB/Spo0J family partition protein [Streptomyces somaliensis DSM 40738]
MSERRRGLGRGLGALIPAAPQERPAASVGTASTSPTAIPALGAERGIAAAKVTTLPHSASTGSGTAPPERPEEGSGAEVPAGVHFAELPVDSITPNPCQPRQVFDEDALAELVTSIKEVGLLQPVVVRRVAPERYELIMGERRWRACREAGLERVAAIVRETEDEKLLLDALLENLHRAQLNPLEEAAAYDQLLKDFNCTHDQLADRIGRSRPQVSNTLRLLRLPPPVQNRVAAGVLSAGHARALLSLEDPKAQEELAHRIVAEGLSVRAVEEIVTLMASEPRRTARVKGPRAGTRVSPALNELATRLSDRFETRVKVDLGQKKGKIVVEFASMEDLNRILGTLAPGEGRVLDKGALEEPNADNRS